MSNRDIILFIVLSVLSTLFIMWTCFSKVFMTSDIPVKFSMIEGQSFTVRVLIITLLLILVLFFSSRFIKVVTGIYALLTIGYTIYAVNRFFTSEYPIIKYLDFGNVLMYMIPSIVGLLLIYKIKLPEKHNNLQ
ncbi:hypothetical protein ACFOZY_00760 [Chungangia koreensis]|uniref:Uncharacterized protein n=1 Tax=Chungangia koreensis TaxID=752657 RepID=A0ABV8WZN9_9LACT